MEHEFIYFADKLLKKDIGHIKPDQVKPFWSDGKWSMHDLLSYLLDITGPANVSISTFSISEAAIRSFHNSIEEGRIKFLQLLVDYTVRRHKLNLLYFANNITNEIRLAANHSKVILIKNKDWTVTVIGSANMTPNPRKEAGAIFTDRKTHDYFEERFLNTMENGTPF